MVHGFRGGCALESLDNLGVGENARTKLLQPGILYLFDEVENLFVEFFNVVGRAWEEIAKVNLFRLGDTELLQGELGAVAVELDAGLHLDEIVAVHFLGGGFKLVPHARFDGTGAVAKLHAEIGLAIGGAANFLFMNEKKAGNGRIRLEVLNEEFFHTQVPLFFPNKRYFLCCFFSLVTSGVALTSSISELPPPAMSW